MQIPSLKNPVISCHDMGSRDFTYRSYRTYRSYKFAEFAEPATNPQKGA